MFEKLRNYLLRRKIKALVNELTRVRVLRNDLLRREMNIEGDLFGLKAEL